MQMADALVKRALQEVSSYPTLLIVLMLGAFTNAYFTRLRRFIWIATGLVVSVTLWYIFAV